MQIFLVNLTIFRKKMLKYEILNNYQFNQIVLIFMIILIHLIRENRLKNPIMQIFYKKALADVRYKFTRHEKTFIFFNSSSSR